MPQDAALDVANDEFRPDLIQGRTYRGELGHDIYAVALFGQHSPQAPNLAFDSGEPSVDRRARFRIHRFIIHQGV